MIPLSPMPDAPDCAVQPESGTGIRSLTLETLQGLKWTYLATACSAVLQIGVAATMSRLLKPSAFGVIAAAGLFLRFGSYFSEMGLGSAVVQKPVVTDEDIRASFTASTTIGCLVALVVWSCAPLSSHLLANPEVVPVTRLLSVSLALSGLACTSLGLLRRRMNFGVLSLIEVSSYVLSYGAVGIPLAIAGAGLWALTAVLLLQPLLTLCFAYYSVRHSLRPCLRWECHKALLAYGSKLSITSFAEYLFFFAETAVVGKFWGDVVLGIYSRASLIANLFNQNACTAMMKVLFPAFSRAQGDRGRLASAYLSTVTIIGLITMPLALGMVPAAKDIVLIVLGAQYKDAPNLVQVVVLAVPFSMLASVAATICNVKDKVGTRLIQQLCLCIFMWTAVCLAAPWGLRAIATAAVISQALRFAAFQHLANRSLGLNWRDFSKAILPGFLLAGCVCAAVAMAAWGLPTSSAIIRLLIEVTLAAVVCSIMCLWFLPSHVTHLVALALTSITAVEKIPILVWYRSRLLAR